MAILSLKEVSQVRRDASGREVEVLQHLRFDLPEGKLTAIVGPSGGGKSTLVRLLNRLEDPAGGQILFHGSAINTLDPLQLRRRIVLVPQKPYLFAGSVLANLQRPFTYRGEPPPTPESERLQSALAMCGVEADLLGRQGRSLSVGQQQRVCLARALLLEPEVLLLDEPTSALDRPTANRLAATLRSIGKQTSLTVVMVTHDLHLAGKVADRLIFLAGGRVVEQGGTQELLESPRSEELKAFLAEPLEGEGSP